MHAAIGVDDAGHLTHLKRERSVLRRKVVGGAMVRYAGAGDENGTFGLGKPNQTVV